MGADSAGSDRVVIPTRSIKLSKIDPEALKVVQRLQRFGYTAYLVGGCVRDLLLKRIPKDFDVATSARPREIRKLFRNCRLIGRRFRLAHIHFSAKIIETATFRATVVERQDRDLLIHSDNVFGTAEEDARRRDFTINALFYDPVEKNLIDYVGGLEDLVGRILRFIGPPEVWVREDPVRILRAIKFAARLGFEIDPEAWQAIVRYRNHLTGSAPPRLLEEIYRMLRGGAAESSFRLMWQAGVLEIILPELSKYLARALDRSEMRDPGSGLWAYLRAVDRSEPELLTNSVLMAAVIIHSVADAISGGRQAYQVEARVEAAGEVAREILRPMIARLRLPRWEAEQIQQIIAGQRRLFRLRSDSPLPRGLMRRVYFPETLDLFEIGVRATGRGYRTLDRLRKAFRAMSSPQMVPRSKPNRRRSHKHPRPGQRGFGARPTKGP